MISEKKTRMSDSSTSAGSKDSEEGLDKINDDDIDISNILEPVENEALDMEPNQESELCSKSELVKEVSDLIFITRI